MRNSHHLSSIHLSQGQKRAKGIFARYSALLITALMSIFHGGVYAQSVTIKGNQGVSITTRSYDDCASVYEVTLNPSNQYYFEIYFSEDNEPLSPNDLTLEGDASAFQKMKDHLLWKDASYTDKTKTFYLNTRNGKPYTFTSEVPSLSETFIKINGKTTINEGDKLNLSGAICPASSDYTYQWYEDGKAISGETSATLSYAPTSPTATIKWEVSKDGSVVASKSTKIQTYGKNNRFFIENWWAVGSHSIVEIKGYCGALYRADISFIGNNPQFRLLSDWVPVEKIENKTSHNITQFTNDKGDKGWIINSNNINGKKIHFYIDARSYPIQFTEEIEERDFIVATISVKDGDAKIERGESASFEADICKNSTEDVSYQWQSSTDRGTTWSDIESATSNTLENFTPKSDSTYIRVVVTNGTTTSNSNEIVLVYEPSVIHADIENVTKINETEYEVFNHEKVSMSVWAERMKDAVFSVQVKDFSSNTWRDTTFGDGTEWSFEPKENLVYKVIATGTLNNTNEHGSISREFIIRIIHHCDKNAAADTLWHDDFGHFDSASTYITKNAEGEEETHTGTITDEESNDCPIENYMSADPNFFVKQHKFASLDPLFGAFSGDCSADGYKHYSCWEDCNGIRVEDGYYSILTNPNTSNCGRSDRDYWDGSDHTGNKNGGMLFVNCSDNSKGTIIYERELSLSNKCDNVQLLFSAYISNAAIKEGQKPVNVRLDIRDEDMKLIHTVASGDIMPRTTGEKWTNMTFQFKSTGKKKYIIQLTNNNEGGAENFGNDILLDDISITICYPNVNLISDFTNRVKDTIETCQLDTVINLYAFNENGIKNYIDEPVFLFQYKKADDPSSKWQDVEIEGEAPHFTEIDHTQIKLTSTDERFFGKTKFRSIVASSKEILAELLEEENTDGEISMVVDCDHVYAIDSAFVVIFDYSGPMGDKISVAGCIGEEMTITGDAADKPYYKWENADTEELISENEKVLKFVIDGSQEVYHFNFIGIERLGCTDTQMVTVKKKDLVWFDAPKEFIVCEYDSVLTLTNIALNNSSEKPTFTWELNGVVDTKQTGDKFMIPESAPLTGSIKVTGSAEGYCDSTRTIAYTIHKNYQLSLDTDVEDDHLCFNNLNNTITLTATIQPESAMPSKFYWFSNGTLVGENDKPTFQITIEENGIYGFEVKSIDDVCYKDSATGPAAVDTIFASRTADMKLVTTPENAIVCEGEPIKFELEIENALVEKEVSWKSDDVDKKTMTEDFKSEITINPTKSTKFTERRELTISVFDEVCAKPIFIKPIYEVHNNIEVSIDKIETFCLSEGEKIKLNATVAAGEPTKFVWLEGTTRLDSTKTNSANITIKEGSNSYSVIAIDSVCKSQTSVAMKTEARNPITVDIMPKDTIICEGETITFSAKVENALDSKTVLVTWSGDDLTQAKKIEGANCTLDITPVKSNKKTEKREITISVADTVCRNSEYVTASTTYDIHNKIEVEILADRNDGLFCLTDKEDGDKINLKANVTAGEPTQFTWYKDDAKIGTASKADTTVTITVGTNQYKVVASDGICENKASSVAPIKARKQLGLKLEPTDAKICEGESIKLTATLTDPLNDEIAILWKGDDIAEGSKTIGNPSSYTVTTTKTGNSKVTANATVTAHDDVCQRDTVVSVDYDVYMKVEIKLLSDLDELGKKLCMADENSKKTTLTIQVIKGNPSQFIWNDGTVSSADELVRVVSLEEGTNTFSVRATDDVCNKKSDATEAIANNTIETREPIAVDFYVDKGLVCIGNNIQATAGIKNSHPGSTSIITWSNGKTNNNVGNGEYTESYRPKVGNQDISVSVVDSKSDICPATVKTLVITAQDSLRLRISSDSETLCQREDTTQYVKLTVNVTSGMPTSIIWSNDTTTMIDPATNSSSILVGPNENTTYWAYGTDDICKNSDKIYTDEIQVSNRLDVKVEIEKEAYQMGDEIVLIAHLSNDEYTSIKWYNTETGELLGETVENTFRYQLDEDSYGTFKFGVAVDNNHCGEIESGKRKITVADFTEVPNIITPYNENGKNDVFMGPKDGKPGYKVEIYNRYQQMIFEGEEGWDGIYRGYKAEPGTYFYRIFMKDGRVFKGTLEVAKF